jgi:hypothetical protein
MKAKVTKRDRRSKPRVKDLTSKDAANVKGGAEALALHCATGEHIKKAVITV